MEEQTQKLQPQESNELNSTVTIESTFEGGCPSEYGQQGNAKICQGCPGQGLCKSLSQGLIDPEQRQLEVRMKAIKHKVLILSGKGGVGKSSVAAQLSLALSEILQKEKKKVAILDVDICGPNIPRLLGVENQQILNESYGWVPPMNTCHQVKVMSSGLMIHEQDAPIIWRGPRKTNLIRKLLKDTFWGPLEYLIIDTPPGTSDEHLSSISSLKQSNPDGAIIITTPQELSSNTIRKEITFCKKMHLPILGIIENMSGFSCPCCSEVTYIFQKDGGKKLAEEYHIPFLGSIPLDPLITELLDQGKCTLCSSKERPLVQSFLNIAKELIKNLKK